MSKGDKGQKGEVGQKGATGQKGDKGNVGTSILTGYGVPDSLLGDDGDVYIDIITDDMYTKIIGIWVLDTNIKGEKGDPGASNIGFSAFMGNPSQISTDGVLVNWTKEPIPYFDTDDFDGIPRFDEIYGVYTVPNTGYYNVKLVFNYQLDSVPGTSLGSGIPYVAIMRNGTEISKSPLPMFEVDIPSVLTFKTLLRTGNCVLSVDYRLGDGDSICVCFNSDGETLPALNIGSSNFQTLFSIHQIG